MIKQALWRKFCGADGRFDFANPFVYGGWRYATDGHVMLRYYVSKTRADTASDRLPIESVKVTYADVWDRAIEMCLGEVDLMNWPSPTLQQPRKCCHCNERGRDPSDMMKCEYCDGSGTLSYKEFVFVNGGRITGELANMINQLPDVKIAKEGELIQAGRYKVIVFIFGDPPGHGMVAQIVPKEEVIDEPAH